MSITLGQTVRLSVADVVGSVPTDPTAISVAVTDPFSNTLTYTTTTTPAIIRDGVGLYHVDVVPVVVGTFTYVWTSTGAGAAANSGSFTIVAPIAVRVPYNSSINTTAIVDMRQNFDPEEFRSAIYSNANAERIRWWSAYPDLTFDPQRGAASGGNAKWKRIENLNAANYMAVVYGSSFAEIWFPDGDIVESDIVIATMGDEMPVKDHDWVMPYGMLATLNNQYPDARIVRMSDEIVRGAIDAPQSGIVTSTGNVVAGVGTTFATDFQPGDIIRALGQSFMIQTIPSNVSLTLAGTPSPTWNQHSFVKGVDRLISTPAVIIFDARDGSKIYTPNVDVTINTDNETVEWGTNSPVPGSRYSITYGMQPVYEVQSNLGVQHHVVMGQVMTQTIVCRLRNKDSERE